MRTITVVIEYAEVSPAVLENVVGNSCACFVNWHEIDEDSFEFSVYCRQEDASMVEDRLAQYV